MSLFRRLNLADSWLMPITAHEHRPIVAAIASGDPERAGRAMFEHAMDSKNRTISNELARATGVPLAAKTPRRKRV